MKTFLKHIAITAFIFIFNLQNFAQLQTPLIKYWYYRNRLNNYFVVPGEKIGESQVICVRNKIYSDSDDPDYEPEGPDLKSHKKNIDYGQHGKYQGLYISVLATEYYLLKKNGQFDDALITEQELFWALNAIKVYWDEKAEPFFNKPESFNGFFIRGNVPCDFLNDDPINHPNGFTTSGESHLKLLNKGLTENDIWYDANNGSDIYMFGDFSSGSYLPRGHPGYIDHRTALDCDGKADLPSTVLHHYTYNPEHPECEHTHLDHPESVSQDEAIWILLGCELTIKLDAGGYVANLAFEIKLKILDYLINIYHLGGWETFQLYEPVNDFPICEYEGGSTYTFGKPLCLLDIINTNFNSTLYWDDWQSLLWRLTGLKYNKNFDLIGCLAAMTDSWLTTGAGIMNVTAKVNCETFYTLLWEVLQNKTRPEDKQTMIVNKALDQINAAPCEGPYCYKPDEYYTAHDAYGNEYLYLGGGIYSGNGWAATYKWCQNEETQDYGGWCTGNYNGTDYMLLYNLYHIINYESCPYYCNYVDKTISHYLPRKSYNSTITYCSMSNPEKYTAFNSITSSQVIGLQTYPDPVYDPGNVTFVATTSIHLKPGFHVMEGAYFHAYINDIDCSGEESSGKSIEDTNYFNSIYTPYEDSLISMPKIQYELIIEDTTANNNLYALKCPVDTFNFLSINGDTIDDLYTYYWDFGNGITSTKVNPKVLYEAGYYNFMLILTDTNEISDTLRIIIEVPDCDSTVRGTLAENPDCGSLPVPYDSLWLVDVNDSIVAGVTPVITDSIGRFWFLQNELQALDSNAVFAFRSGNEYVLQDTAHHTVQEWLGLSPLQFTLADILKKEWRKVYSSTADSANVYAKAVDLYDNIYVLGRLNSDSTGNDYLTLKYTPSGNLAWTQVYNSPYNNSDKAEAITTDLQCNIIVTGSSKDANGTQDYLTVKYDSAGSQLWVQRYDVSNGSSDAANCLKTDQNANVYVSGLSLNQSSEVNIVTVKYNSSGQMQWTRSFNAGSYSQSMATQRVSMAVDSLGNIYLAGSCRDSLGDIEYVALKYDSTGTLLWQSKKNISSQQADLAAAMAVDHLGNVFVSGTTGTVKFNYNGSYQWLQTGNFSRMVLDVSGNVYVGNALPYSLIKFDNSNGSVLWSDYSKQVNDLAVDKNDDVYVISNYELSKFSSTGDLITSKLFGFTGVSLDVSENLNVYVAGNLSQSQGGTGLADIATAKYSQCPSVASLRSASTHPPDNTAPIVSPAETPIKIVPNPNNGEMVLLSNHNFEIGSIFRIYDLTGRVLYQKTITEETTHVQVNTSNLQNGIYLYSVVSPQGKLLVKDKLVIMK